MHTFVDKGSCPKLSLTCNVYIIIKLQFYFISPYQKTSTTKLIKVVNFLIGYVHIIIYKIVIVFCFLKSYYSYLLT